LSPDDSYDILNFDDFEPHDSHKKDSYEKKCTFDFAAELKF